MTPIADTERRWAKLFMEIVLRAIRRVHFDYGMRVTTPASEMSAPKLRKLNRGTGIELADERIVCADAEWRHRRTHRGRGPIAGAA